ncbi:MAG: hypothetical protein F2754_07665 [Actinobacteria bacterium]|uniref:Unannotated protein n=1 Tax=freshwater metagenome TaxID=449393 RepID=A0A6J6RT88_9ZZZZ|nr:hypothetical protein [Actinomycetota bacterium]MSX87247.1 hypothetical protein [Actinomycetota bacterium]MSY70546.1 hypothetical protein [Actinomycetota bacterium]
MYFDGLVLTVLAVLAGIFVGLARGGRFRNTVGIPVRVTGLLVIGVVVPSLADQFTREVAIPLVLGGLAALLAFAIVNVRIVGMSVMAIGILANLLATFLNGGLPVNREALVDAGLASRAEVDRVELRGARRLEEPTHRVRFLGDIIPLEETGQVLAFGDLIILVGLADIAANLTLHKRKRAHSAIGDDATEVAGAPPPDDAVAVIDLVRVHAPGGPNQPRPRPPGLLQIEPVIVPDLEQPAQYPGLAITSPDIDWRPAAHADRPVVDPSLVLAFVEEPVDVEPIEAELAESAAVIDLREEPVPIAFTPRGAPPAAAAAVAVADDEMFRLLFADLPKSRGHRRRSARTIPDFEPVHVNGITPRGR